MNSALERLRALRRANQFSAPTKGSYEPGHWARLANELLTRVPDLDQVADLRECFNERAGICEFDGCMNRDEAERIAYEELYVMIANVKPDPPST